MKTTTEDYIQQPSVATFIMDCADKNKGRSCLLAFEDKQDADWEVGWINHICGLETQPLKTILDLQQFYALRAMDKNAVVMLNDILMPILHNENQYTSALEALSRILLAVRLHNQNIIIISHKHEGVKIWRSIFELVNYTYNFEA